MNPSDAHSHLATLRQLKEMLDAGTLTPQEFEALKQQMVFGKEAAPVAAPIAPEPPRRAEAETKAEVAAAPTPLASVAPAPGVAVPAEPLTPAEALFEPAAATAPAPETPDWLAAAAPLLPTASESFAPEAERRNPLTLVFAVGGALVLLAIVLYLALGNRTESEHLTSASQTAADSTAVAPEVGPQSEQITLAPAVAPETVRVAPATPPPVAPAAATRFQADSVVAPTPAPAPAPARPAARPAVPTTIATDSAI